MADIDPYLPSVDGSGSGDDVVIDLTADGPLARVAALAVTELAEVLDAGPWYVLAAGGEVLAASGPLTADFDVVARLAVADIHLAVASDPRAGEFSPEDHETIDRMWAMVSEVADARRRAAEADARARNAEARATVDALTGLTDQGEWWRRLDALDHQVERHERPIAVAVIDLDDLKAANDSKGHLHGDLLLKLTAHVLLNSVRTGDLVARVGGDEFAVLAVDHDPASTDLDERLTSALAAAGLSASVGVALHPHHPSLRDAFAAADRAMYRAKSERKRAAPS